MRFLQNPLVCAVAVREDFVTTIIAEKLSPKLSEQKLNQLELPFKILAKQKEITKGYQKAHIVDHQKLVQSIENAIAKAEAQINDKVKQIYITMQIKNLHLKTFVVEKIIQESEKDEKQIVEKIEKQILQKFNIVNISKQQKKYVVKKFNQNKQKFIQISFTALNQDKKQNDEIQLLQQQLNFPKIQFFPNPIIMAEIAKYNQYKQYNTICIDIDLQSTEVVFIHNQNLLFSNQIDVGIKTAIDGVLQNVNANIDIQDNSNAAFDHKYLYQKNINGYDPKKALNAEAIWNLVENIQNQMFQNGYQKFYQNDKTNIIINAKQNKINDIYLCAKKIFDNKIIKIKNFANDIKFFAKNNENDNYNQANGILLHISQKNYTLK